MLSLLLVVSLGQCPNGVCAVTTKVKTRSVASYAYSAPAPQAPAVSAKADIASGASKSSGCSRGPLQRFGARLFGKKAKSCSG